ncbi:alkaline phosphatase, tissue-nonspecific isozyme-like isoform X2 [Belonocnema kinseyi]|uniref:alkaline phosphatase, tissue-nonspecific isozyme-like isoform X2 n=1 Tax=Belonocnema kinseyi TaxID=2817044 RepID=UPI00143CCB71|nr:alkaline phosphatase, tissue-nonspecific isozyme-like isoform X2 [Belonocnema kinseyi]
MSEAIVSCVKISILLLFLPTVSTIEDSKHWHRLAEEELTESLSYKWNTNIAKNVIIFVGDGMSPDTITASRIFKNGETSYLSWEKFPHIGLLKTYNTNKQVPDSASTATAIFGGVKTNFKVVGVDMNVPLADCEASLNTDFHVQSIISWAQEVGKSTGFVTTTRVTHATPAPLYAHCPDRRWECEAKKPANAEKCKDIARQLIENEPGKSIKVIMGGGRQMLQSLLNGTASDPIDKWACRSKDGRDLIEKWRQDKKSRKISFEVVQNNEELSKVDYEKTEFLFGIFANGHIAMDWQRDKSPKGQPSLEEMTAAAIKILDKSDKGYLLVVEGGLIDFAHHRGHAAQALLETVRFSEAINATLKLVNTEETLVIVTSDHTHSMAFNGYSERGSSILGVAQKSKFDKISYTTLTYNTGGPNNIAYKVRNGEAVRMDPSLNDTTHYNYSQQAAIISDEAYHGGGDVAVYAIGPQAHLFHSTHEQNFVAHVIAYAAKIGPYKKVDHRKKSGANQQWITHSSVIISIIMIVLFKIYH